MPAPLIAAGAAGAAAAAPALKNLGKKAADAIGGLVKEGIGHRENLFFDHRDGVFSTLRGNSWTPEKEWAPIAEKYKFAHSQVADWQMGNYADEFYRLHQFVQEYLNNKQPGLGNAFWAKAWQIAAQLEKSVPDPSRSYKGAANEGLQWALANRNNVQVTEILNNSDGLSIGQPYQNEVGQVVVPSTQQGDGIFSQLNNYAAALTNQIGGQITSTVAANLSGQKQLAAGGGVTLTGGATVGNPVTTNTTSNNNNSSSGSSNVLLIVIVVVLLAITGVFKKLF